jgi:hypothetical protein
MDIGCHRQSGFIAPYLYEPEDTIVSERAARAIATLTGRDFGFPKKTGGSIRSYDHIGPLLKARKWWEKFKPRNDPH